MGTPKEGEASSRQLTARSGVWQREEVSTQDRKTCEDVEGFCRGKPLRYSGEGQLFIHMLILHVWEMIFDDEYLMSFLYLRCQPCARGTAGAPLTPPDVQQESVSCWMAVDAVKFARGSSLRTAAGHSRVTTQRGWSATLEGFMAPLRASVEVRWLLFLFFYFLFFVFWWIWSLFSSYFEPHNFFLFL